MQNWIIEIMEQYGYLGVFLMMTLENLFPPIPSEIVLPFGGFLTSYTNLTVFAVIIAASLGSVIGAMVLYCAGMVLDVSRMEKIIARYGSLLRMKQGDISKAAEWFDKYGYWTVFLCRMVPFIRSLISIPAGMANMNFFVFVLLTAAGTLIWNIILITAGVTLGENWDNILSFMNVYSNIVYLLFIFGGLSAVYFIWRKKKNK